MSARAFEEWAAERWGKGWDDPAEFPTDMAIGSARWFFAAGRAAGREECAEMFDGLAQDAESAGGATAGSASMYWRNAAERCRFLGGECGGEPKVAVTEILYSQDDVNQMVREETERLEAAVRNRDEERKFLIANLYAAVGREPRHGWDIIAEVNDVLAPEGRSPLTAEADELRQLVSEVRVYGHSGTRHGAVANVPEDWDERARRALSPAPSERTSDPSVSEKHLAGLLCFRCNARLADLSKPCQRCGNGRHLPVAAPSGSMSSLPSFTTTSPARVAWRGLPENARDRTTPARSDRDADAKAARDSDRPGGN